MPFVAGCQYMPCIELFAHWRQHDLLMLEACEHYPKRAWRNKTGIQGHDRPMILSVPLKKGKHNRMAIQKVEISYDEDWPRIHLASLKSIYSKSPFFGELEAGISDILLSRHVSLWELNISLLRYYCSLIQGSWDYILTKDYQKEYDLPDYRAGLPAGKSSLYVEKIPVYPQVQRLEKSFIPNLSILDLLCHLGPGSGDYLDKYALLLSDN